MAAAFDPYEKWLGIPPSEQPPNFYRLLGVELFESDRQTIDAAAKRHMRNLQAEVAGPNGPIARQLLVEISDARICLMMPDRRKAYDHGLHTDPLWRSQPPRNSRRLRPSSRPRPRSNRPLSRRLLSKKPAHRGAPCVCPKAGGTCAGAGGPGTRIGTVGLGANWGAGGGSSLDSAQTLEFAEADEPVELDPIDEADSAETAAEADEIVELEAIAEPDGAEEAVELEPADETEEPVELEAEVAEDDVEEMADDAVELEPADEPVEAVELEAVDTEEAEPEAMERAGRRS